MIHNYTGFFAFKLILTYSSYIFNYWNVFLTIKIGAYVTQFVYNDLIL